MFTKAPFVFLTAEHSVLGQKHDAATLWVENVNSKGFEACLREMQNFDGLHENITVVNLKKDSTVYYFTHFKTTLFYHASTN